MCTENIADAGYRTSIRRILDSSFSGLARMARWIGYDERRRPREIGDGIISVRLRLIRQYCRTHVRLF